MPKPTPDLYDVLLAAQASARGPGCLCPVGVILDRLPADQAASVRKALALPQEQLQSSVAARELSKLRLHPRPEKQLADDAVRKHRKGSCGCAR